MQDVINFITSHSALMAAMMVAIMDFVMALVPSWESNGIFHSIYIFFKNLVSKQ